MKRALTEQDIIRAKRFNYAVFAIVLAGLLALGVWLIQYISHTFTPEKWQTATPGSAAEALWGSAGQV